MIEVARYNNKSVATEGFEVTLEAEEIYFLTVKRNNFADQRAVELRDSSRNYIMSRLQGSDVDLTFNYIGDYAFVFDSSSEQYVLYQYEKGDEPI